MKKILLFLILAISMTIANKAIAQCGVDAIISLSGVLSITPSLESANTVFQPGYMFSSCKWKNNGAVISTSASTPMNYSFPAGLNEICLEVTGINMSLGDTCISTYCNIFSSTAQQLYPVIAVSGSGFTKTLQGYYFGGNSVCCHSIAPGDSNIVYNGISASHTYSSSGTFNCSYYVDNNFISHTVSRNINVNNGHEDLKGLQSNGISYSAFDSVGMTLNTTPPYNYGTVGCIPSVADFAPGNIYHGVAFGATMRVPGQSLFAVNLRDSANNQVKYYYPVVIGPAYINPPDTVYGFVWDDIDADGLKDSTEGYLQGEMINAHNYNTSTDSNGNYSLLLPHANTSISISANPVNITYPNISYGSLYFLNGVGHTGYNFGLTQNVGNICGTVFIDYNNDSIYSPGTDKPVSAVTIKAHNTILGYDYYENVNPLSGYYCMTVPIGTYEITLSYIYLDSAIVYPDTNFVILTGGSPIKNFAVNSLLTGGNLQMHLGASSEARPGFPYHLTCRVTNMGIDSISGTVVLNFDPALSINTVFPASGIIDNVNKTVTWQSGMIMPTASKFFTAGFTIPFSTALGTTLHHNATVTPDPGLTDYDLTNNIDSRNQVVMGSFDPNDKLVSPRGTGPTGDIHHDTRLHYRINFQNTGTASAINIIVQDEIDPDLDLNTLLMNRASHSYNMVTNGRTVTWKFLGINLPDSNTNEPLSHGFIEFSISPGNGLPDGTTIDNHADIYFDFNDPVITNTVTNTLETNITAIDEKGYSDGFEIYPNPADGNLNITLKENQHETIYCEITDLTGRIILEADAVVLNNRQAKVYTGGMANGTYFIKVNRRFVKLFQVMH